MPATVVVANCGEVATVSTDPQTEARGVAESQRVPPPPITTRRPIHRPESTQTVQVARIQLTQRYG